MKNERNIRIVYQYDGSKFSGFQRQKGVKTVQGEIENIILKSFDKKINMVSSGRTDRGVHALGQVSNFLIDRSIPLEAIKGIVNRRLYGEVKILDIGEVEGGFNARFDAKMRTYLYIMKDERDISPHEANYVSRVREKVEAEQLQEIMSEYIGRHDFASFMKKDRAMRNTVREIFEIRCAYDGNDGRIGITVCGSSFLKSMVRIMIGSALAIYFGREGKDYIKIRLSSPDMDIRKVLAPAEGLYLYKVEY